MAALRHDDGLGFLNFASFTTGLTTLSKTAVPKVIEASIQKKLAKSAAKTAKYAAAAAAPAAVVMAPAAQPQTQYAPPQQMAMQWPSWAKPAALTGGAVVGVLMLKNMMQNRKQP